MTNSELRQDIVSGDWILMATGRAKRPHAYKRKAVRSLNEDEYNQYKKYTERRTLNKWEVDDIQLLIDLYAKVFAIQYYMRSFCKNCNGSGQILLKMSNELDLIYESYDTRG